MASKKILIGQELASQQYNLGRNNVNTMRKYIFGDAYSIPLQRHNLNNALNSLNDAILCYKDALEAKPNPAFKQKIERKMDGLLNSQEPFIYRQLASVNKLM